MYNKLNKARNVSKDQQHKNNNHSDKGKKRISESNNGNSSKVLKTDDVDKNDKSKERFCDHCKMKNHTTKNCFKLKKEKAKESKGNKDKEKEKVKDAAPEKSTKSLKGSSQ